MRGYISIHKLSSLVGLTSRTLRHWESEGLFISTRDENSGWRMYDEDAVLSIRITAFLRELDIPINDIKSVIEESTIHSLQNVILNRISIINTQKKTNVIKEKQLNLFLACLIEQNWKDVNNATFKQLFDKMTLLMKTEYESEDFKMFSEDENSLRFITLPPMRVVYNISISNSPEDEVMRPVIDWLKSEGLLGTARLLGGNVNPMPSSNGKPYGYGMCASIPENIIVPDSLKEMKLPGGLYAMLSSSDDIGESWKKLMKLLSLNKKYMVDKSRLCFEEHFRNEKPDGCGNEYSINLLEPIVMK